MTRQPAKPAQTQAVPSIAPFSQSEPQMSKSPALADRPAETASFQWDDALALESQLNDE